MVAVKTAHIVGLTGDFAGKSYPVGDSILIGRHDSAGLRLSNLEVSRRHCQIDWTGDCFRVIDLGSRSGIRLNDVAVKEAEICSGDLLTVGPHTFRLEVLGDEPFPESATMALDDPAAQMMIRELRVGDYNLARQLDSASSDASLDRLRHHLEIVQDFSRAIQTTLEVAKLLDLTLEELFRVFSKMDAGVIFLRDRAGGDLKPAAIRRRNVGNSGPVGYSTTILRSVVAEQKAVVLLDVSQDARFQDAISVKLGSMRTHMCVPLIVSSDVVGAIYLVAEGRQDADTGFDSEDLALLASLSGTVAVCVRNAELARESQRQAQLNTNLQRYVSPEVTRRLIEQGVAGAFAARTADGVIMFCDLVGFTALSERLAPDRMARLLNRYFHRALEIVFRYHGSVNKFGGDSFLAIWGAIDPSPADLANAVQAALEIQNSTFTLGAELAGEGGDPIELTIGLNRGRFFAGDIGSQERMEFTVIGDAVNVAARIQSLAHGNQVLSTVDSIESIRQRVSLFRYPGTGIRGRAADVEAASIRAIVVDDPVVRDAESSAADLVNRHQSPRMLVSVPIQIIGSTARSLLVGAQLGAPAELVLLSSEPCAVQQRHQLAPILPELTEAFAPVETQCTACEYAPPCHVVRMRPVAPASELELLPPPGSPRLATRSLRQKS